MSVLKVIRTRPDAILPVRATPQSAGLDLCVPETIVLEPGQRKTIPTGLVFGIPERCYVRLAPRSGLAHKYGVCVLAGVIDRDYAGDIGVILHNTGNVEVTLGAGIPIAQAILERYEHADVVEVIHIDRTSTVRGSGGFGSTDRA